MSESRVLETRCGNCGCKMRVKTRSKEKVVACPKCNSQVTISATAGAPEGDQQQTAVESVPSTPNPVPEAQPDVGGSSWIFNKSTRTFRLWCAEDWRNDPNNVLRIVRGQSYIRHYYSSEVTISYPPLPGRHILNVTCPRCGYSKRVLVQVLDEAARKREIKMFFLPLTLLGTALFWLAAWFFYGQVSSWPGIVALVLIGIFVHLFPAACIAGLLSPYPGLSARVANLLPADEHTKEDGGEIGWHSISCLKGDSPDFLSVDELEIR